MRKTGWWLLLVVLSLLLFSSSPIFSSHRPVPSLRVFWIAHLFLPLVLWTWIWFGPQRGVGTVGWASGVVGFLALALREHNLFWLPVEFVGLGVVCHYGMAKWQGTLGSILVHRERAEEDVNTLENELRNLNEGQLGLYERLQRYQQLRQIANSFHACLVFDQLIRIVVERAGSIIQKADLALLYLSDPKTLELELKAVWRRSGSQAIKAKKGDPFDFWVMRQAQPLLVEEPQNDFRFPGVDPEELGRPLGALLAVPLMSGHRFLGVLRLESIHPRGLGSEDLRLAGIIGDLAALGLANSRLYTRMEELAITDDLTGLTVRQYFQKRLSQELLRAGGLHEPVSILLIDIDRFKGYNDSFGHSAGDKLLKTLARLLLRMQHPGEVTARFGGEEFICLLPGVDQGAALRRAEKIRMEVESMEVELRRSLTHTTVSIGVATFPGDGEEPDLLFKIADGRLYQAKEMGRNRVCVT